MRQILTHIPSAVSENIVDSGNKVLPFPAWEKNNGGRYLGSINEYISGKKKKKMSHLAWRFMSGFIHCLLHIPSYYAQKIRLFKSKASF